jgi:hypothetical protein
LKCVTLNSALERVGQLAVLKGVQVQETAGKCVLVLLLQVRQRNSLAHELLALLDVIAHGEGFPFERVEVAVRAYCSVPSPPLPELSLVNHPREFVRHPRALVRELRELCQFPRALESSLRICEDSTLLVRELLLVELDTLLYRVHTGCGLLRLDLEQANSLLALEGTLL